MYDKKYNLVLDQFDRDLLINGINEFRNQLLCHDLPTQDVDNLLLRLIDMPSRKEIRRGDYR